MMVDVSRHFNGLCPVTTACPAVATGGRVGSVRFSPAKTGQPPDLPKKSSIAPATIQKSKQSRTDPLLLETEGMHRKGNLRMGMIVDHDFQFIPVELAGKTLQ